MTSNDGFFCQYSVTCFSSLSFLLISQVYTMGVLRLFSPQPNGRLYFALEIPVFCNAKYIAQLHLRVGCRDLDHSSCSAIDILSLVRFSVVRLVLFVTHPMSRIHHYSTVMISNRPLWIHFLGVANGRRFRESQPRDDRALLHLSSFSILMSVVFSSSYPLRHSHNFPTLLQAVRMRVCAGRRQHRWVH